MSMMLLFEAAGRVLAMGLLTWCALRALNIKLVRAQRIAWLLTLAGAMLMPVLVGLQIGPKVLPTLQQVHLPQDSGQPAAAADQRTVVAQWSGAAQDTPRAAETSQPLPVARYAAVLYLVVTALLLVRLALGASMALRIRRRASRIDCSLAPGVDIRVSGQLRAPVTICSSVVLPKGYSAWPHDILRVVLSHESAHVRHRDFYVQLLAGLHCALFWFNPFSWWVRAELAELGEALSDHAAVQHAASRASYAEILLAFASGSGPAAAVAMARPSNLTSRIDRLLSERGFQQCFAERRPAVLIACTVVAVALAAATSVARVEAAMTGFVTSDEAYDVDSAPAAPTPLPPQPSASTSSATVSTPPEAPSPPAAPPAPPAAASAAAAAGADKTEVVGNKIYFHHQGRRYVVQIPAIPDDADSLLAPVRELTRAQQELAREAETLAHERLDLHTERHDAALATPDFRKDIEELNQIVGQMKLAEAAPQIRHETLADLQRKLADIQGRLAADEGQVAVRRETERRESEELRALNEQQARLGREMGRLSEQQRKLIERTLLQLRPILEKAVRDGQAAPVG